MKKKIIGTVIGLFIIIAVSVIYYFSIGKNNLIEQLKEKTQHEITLLQNNGFTITQNPIDTQNDHFEISIKDTKTATKYLQSQGIELNEQNIKAIEGMVWGTDIAYLPDTQSALSADLYPLQIPLSDIEQWDTATQNTIQTILKNKTLLAHIEINLFFDHFSGSLKDINQTHTVNNKTNRFVMNGFVFEGELEQKKVTQSRQKIDTIMLQNSDGTVATLSQFKGSSTANPFELSHFMIKQIEISHPEGVMYDAYEISSEGETKEENGLLHLYERFEIQKLTFEKEYTLNTLKLETEIQNLDTVAVATLQKQTIDDIELSQAINTILSKGVVLKLSQLSIESITAPKGTIPGLMLNGYFKPNPTFDFFTPQNDPQALLYAIDGNATLQLSSELLGVLGQDPRLMMGLMLFPPQDYQGKKQYQITIQNGKVKLNNQPLL